MIYTDKTFKNKKQTSFPFKLYKFIKHRNDKPFTFTFNLISISVIGIGIEVFSTSTCKKVSGHHYRPVSFLYKTSIINPLCVYLVQISDKPDWEQQTNVSTFCDDEVS